MKGRLYVRCPHCEAEEPSRVQCDGSSVDETPATAVTLGGTSQQCSVCGIDVLVSEATTFFRS